MEDKNIFQNDSGLKIDLGCGSTKKNNFIGVDVNYYPGVDYTADLEEGLSFISDNSVDEYFSSHFLEHVQNFEGLLKEIYRTIKPNGKIEIIVPHFSNPYYYSDYTHKRFFGLYTFDYFSSKKQQLKRKVPFYNSMVEFEVLERKLVFKSSFNLFLNLFRKHVFQRIFNSTTYMQELYENLFSRLIPCSEIRFVLKPVKNN